MPVPRRLDRNGEPERRPDVPLLHRKTVEPFFVQPTSQLRLGLNNERDVERKVTLARGIALVRLSKLFGSELADSLEHPIAQIP